MSTTYKGVANNVTIPAVRNIASSTNTNPIQVTTTAPHLFTDGERIQIEGHTLNYNANGIWPIVVTGASTFTLTGSTGAAAGVAATGTATSLGLNPALMIPSDGDDRNASGVNTPIELLADQALYLAERRGSYRLAHYGVFAYDNVAGLPWVGLTAWLGPVLLGNAAWANTGAWTLFGTAASAMVMPNDIIEVSMTGSMQHVAPGAASELSLFVDIHEYGVAAAFGAAVKMIGSSQAFFAAATLGMNFNLRGYYTAPTPGVVHGMVVTPFVAGHDYIGGTNVNFVEDYLQELRIWRLQA